MFTNLSWVHIIRLLARLLS